MANGILIAAFDYSTSQPDEFHDWYDLEHIPERQAVPGFNACRRWVNTKSEAIATYDLETVEVLDSPPYQAIGGTNLSAWSKRVTNKCRRLLRFEGSLIGGATDASSAEAAGGLLINAMNIPAEHEADFNAWYDEEHLPALRQVPGTIDAWRYRGRAASTHRYIAVYYLDRAEVARSDEWKAAANSPWTERVRTHFQDHVRILAEAYDRSASTETM